MAGISVKQFLPNTLLGRSLMILVTPVVLIQAFTIFIFFDRHWSKITTRLAFAASGEISMIVQEVKDEPLYISHLQTRAKKYLDVDVAYTPSESIPLGDKTSGAKIWEYMVAERLSKELSAQINEGFVIHTDFSEKKIKVFIQLKDGMLKVSLPQRRLYSSSGYVFLLWMVGSSVLLLLIAMLFMRNQIRPIRKLAAAAERFGKGRDSPYFKPEGAREVRQAGHAFIDMRRRISRQVNQRTDMLAGVSHDLRTPLTRMKLQTEMMDEGADKEGIREDLQDMERMIEGYLDFVRGDGEEEFVHVNIAEVFAKLIGAMQRQMHVEIDLDLELDLTCALRPLAFERAMSNILNNAARYAGHIWVSGTYVKHKNKATYVRLCIEDDGPGIPESQYSEMFKPFKRLDTSRNAETGGVGLGLSISLDIVHAHGGSIDMDRSAHGGLAVIILLPI